MENQNTSMLQNALIWGLVLGVVQIIVSLVLFFLGLNLEAWTSYVSIAILIVILIFSTIYYRDKVLGGHISYGKALGFGVLTTLIASLLIAVYSYVFYTIIDPDSIQKILDLAEEALIKQNMPDEQIETTLSFQKMMLKPIIMSLMVIPGTTFYGFIISLITSIFLKKDKPFSSFE